MQSAHGWLICALILLQKVRSLGVVSRPLPSAMTSVSEGNGNSAMLWASLSILVVATLYMAGGALWREWPIFFIGVHLFVLNLVGLVAGPGWHALLTAVGGGGGFIVAGLLMHRRREWTGR